MAGAADAADTVTWAYRPHYVTVVRCSSLNPEYIRSWLRSDYVYGSVEGEASGSTNQVELTLQLAKRT